MIGVALIVAGVLAVCGALVWVWGPWGLMAAGVLCVVAGLLPDWERVSAEHSSQAPR